jgi:hypothetical protein
MRKIIQIYALTVCFFTMACFAISTGVALWNVAKLAIPSLAISNSTYKSLQSDESYSESLYNSNSYRIKENIYTVPTGDLLTKERIRKKEEILEANWHSTISTLVFTLIIIFVDIFVYWFHWRMVRTDEA